MNNSKALSQLKDSAKRQTEELKSSVNETHAQSLKQLEKDLTALHDRKLSAMQKRLREELQKPQKHPWQLITLIGVLSTVLGLLTGAWSMKEFNPSNTWIVPGNMRHEQDGTKYVRSQSPLYSDDKTTTFIKLEK